MYCIQNNGFTVNVTGRVLVALRGNCSFLEKALWAQRAGAVALLIGNNRIPEFVLPAYVYY